MKEETAKSLHEEMLSRARQAKTMAEFSSVQFVKSGKEADKATALRYMAEEELWSQAANLVQQARAAG